MDVNSHFSINQFTLLPDWRGVADEHVSRVHLPGLRVLQRPDYQLSVLIKIINVINLLF